MLERRWVRYTVIFAAWTLLGLFFATQNYINSVLVSSYSTRRLTWRQATAIALNEWYTWALLAPPILWLSRRFPIERPRRLRNLVVHSGR